MRQEGGNVVSRLGVIKNVAWGSSERTKKALSYLFGKVDTTHGKDGRNRSEQKEGETNGKKGGLPPGGRTSLQRFGLLAGPLAFLLILLFVSPTGMSSEAQAVLASTAWVAIWWITEAVPIPVTSLLPIVLFTVTGAVETSVASSYADNTIFLFLGGFIIALAMEKWNLHKRIALSIIAFVGTSTERLILGFMVATGFLSMWISNTATAMMMMPIGLAIIAHASASTNENLQQSNFGKGLMLGIGYSASVGGLGTLIGTPPNTIFAGVIDKMYGIDISFAKWMLFGVPLSIFLMAIVWFYLVKIAFKPEMKQLPGGKEVIDEERAQLGRMSIEERRVLYVFVFAAFFWITRTFLPVEFIKNNVNDTTIAIIAAVLLFVIPSKKTSTGTLMTWTDTKNVPWGILLLFGGGLAIADGFKQSGLALWIGEQLYALNNIPLWLVIGIVATLVLFLTEVTSNTATATMMFPIMAALATALGVHPYGLMIAAGIAASCAFMLPVATPPNAIVFGSGLLKIQDMMKAGIWINLFCIFLITAAVYFLLPFVWGIDLHVLPEMFR